MIVTIEPKELRVAIQQWRQQGDVIAFVPTMGNLHAGHLSLVSQARDNADRVVVSIFVNPLQFAPTEDFANYPRTLAEDLDQLSGYDVDLVFTPSEEMLYPAGREQHARVQVPVISSDLCGISRPHFFGGVATVVTKLFNLVQPDQAIFGQKDYQQFLVIKQLVRDLNMPIEVKMGSTVREADGLPMSSRNQYLTPGERQQAPQLFTALSKIVEKIKTNDNSANLHNDTLTFCSEAMGFLENSGFKVDYLTVRNKHTLALPVAEDSPQNLIVLTAAWLGKTRLLDNLVVES
jgi:pantoate--beta-alanine ligase